MKKSKFYLLSYESYKKNILDINTEGSQNMLPDTSLSKVNNAILDDGFGLS
jgi:hypothetical protein